MLYGEQFRTAQPNPDDRLVAYGRLDEYVDVLARFNRNHVWHYVVDESNSASPIYEKAMSYMRSMKIKNIIVTYQNADHLRILNENGFKYAIMPQTMPGIRKKQAKLHDVLLSGQLSPTIYPTRTRAWHSLALRLPKNVLALPSPGQDISTRYHNTIREAYYELMDRCRMGIVCKAGTKDRFVAKYIEMGACHMLPIGDCPSYMPAEMKNSMVNIEDMSDVESANEVMRLLNAPDELESRTQAYVRCVSNTYMSIPNMMQLINVIMGDQS